jgi:hypothetical protein
MVVYNDRTTICFASFRLEEKLDAILAYRVSDNKLPSQYF